MFEPIGVAVKARCPICKKEHALMSPFVTTTESPAIGYCLDCHTPLELGSGDAWEKEK